MTGMTLENSKKSIEKIGELVKIFPKAQLICFWILYSPVVLISKPDSVREFLKINKIVEKTSDYEYLKPVFGTGLLTSGIGKWKIRRKLLNPCFHPDILRDYLEVFNKNSRTLIKVLEKETQEDFTNIVNPLTLCAFDTVCETIFGSEVGALKNDHTQISYSVKRFASIVMTRVNSFWLWSDIIFRNTIVGKEFERHKNLIHDFVKNVIEEKKKKYLNGERTIYNGRHKAVIDVLLEKYLDTKEFSEADVREEVITFMAAGHETIAEAVMWALYLIGHHPEIQDKLHEELDRVFGEDRERSVTEEDLSDLQYMDCVLKESQRLYSTVPIVGRLVTEEITICGYTLPKNTTCGVPIYFLHRDEEVFPDPEKFNPERFSLENRKNIPEFAYIPFSSGPRNCIGFKFAEMEMGTMMSHILRNFTVESLNQVLPIPGVSLHASEPIRMKIRYRDAHKNKDIM